MSDHQHFSRTIRNSYPPSPFLSSMGSTSLPPRISSSFSFSLSDHLNSFLLAKPPRDSAYESSSLFKQPQQIISGRPLSLSISTATTYTSSVTDSSASPVPPPPSMNTFRPYSSFRNHFTANHVVRLAEEEKVDV